MEEERRKNAPEEDVQAVVETLLTQLEQQIDVRVTSRTFADDIERLLRKEKTEKKGGNTEQEEKQHSQRSYHFSRRRLLLCIHRYRHTYTFTYD